METEWYGDALCFVLANNRHASTILQVLKHFLPNHIQQTEDYALSDEDLEVEFVDEAEMLHYFQTHSGRCATRYWQEPERTETRLMIGAHFTSDAQLIISLTADSNGRREEDLFLELKHLLQSETGLISYNYFPEFNNGAAFKLLCSSL